MVATVVSLLIIVTVVTVVTEVTVVTVVTKNLFSYKKKLIPQIFFYNFFLPLKKSTTEILIKLQNSNCDESQTLKL